MGIVGDGEVESAERGVGARPRPQRPGVGGVEADAGGGVRDARRPPPEVPVHDGAVRPRRRARRAGHDGLVQNHHGLSVSPERAERSPPGAESVAVARSKFDHLGPRTTQSIVIHVSGH